MEKISVKWCRLSFMIFTFMLIATMNADAQWSRYYRQSKIFYFGLDGGIGMRDYTFQSKNIPELDNMPAALEGLNTGIFFGSDLIQAKMRLGQFQSSQTNRERVKVNETEAGLRFYPFPKTRMKNSYFRPYVSMSLIRSNIRFFGTFEMPHIPVVVDSTPGSTCPGSLPADPDGEITLAAEPTFRNETHERGSKLVTYSSIGAGLTILIPLEHTFFNLNAGIDYGLPVAIKNSTQALAQTSVTPSVGINLGISFGLRYRKF